MKTLLAILGSMSVGISPAIATLSTSPIYNQQSEQGKWEAPTSMRAIQEGVNKHYERLTSPRQWSQDIAAKVQKNYDEFMADRSASLSVLQMVPITETIDNTFQDSYVNNTPNKQTFQTHSYSKKITNTSTFNVLLREDVSVKVRTGFFFGDMWMTGTFSSTQSWTDTKTITETVTAPSQPFTVDPYSRGIANYVIKSGTYNVSGALRYYFSPDEKFWTSYFINERGEEVSALYTLGEIVGYLNQAGYGKMMRMDSPTFSVISTDNPDNPKTIAINIPITYVSNGGKMDVEFTQVPLN